VYISKCETDIKKCIPFHIEPHDDCFRHPPLIEYSEKLIPSQNATGKWNDINSYLL